MTAAMLILFTAYRIPTLRRLVGQEVLLAGGRLGQLIQNWTEILGDPNSPSVAQSLRLISKIDDLIQEDWAQRGSYPIVQQISGS